MINGNNLAVKGDQNLNVLWESNAGGKWQIMEFRIAACDLSSSLFFLLLQLFHLLRAIMDGSSFSVDIRMVHIKESRAQRICLCY